MSTQRGSVESTIVVGPVATESANTTTTIIITTTTTTNRHTRPPPLVLDTSEIVQTIGPTTVGPLPSAVYSSPLRSRDSSVFRDCPIWRVCEEYASRFCFPSPPFLNKIRKPTWIAFKKEFIPNRIIVLRDANWTELCPSAPLSVPYWLQIYSKQSQLNWR